MMTSKPPGINLLLSTGDHWFGGIPVGAGMAQAGERTSEPAGFWLLDSGFSILASEFWLLNSGF
jgi:hypothetical protein